MIRSSRIIVQAVFLLVSVLFTSCSENGADGGPTGTWVRKNNYPGGFYSSPPVFVIGTKAYVMKGRELWEYDQPTDTWTQRKNLPYPSGDKDGAFAFALNGKGYVGCGGGAVSSKDFWQYDPATDTWIQKTDFPGGKRAEALSFVASGKAYVVGGQNISVSPSILIDVWEFDAAQDTWIQKGDFPGPGRIHANAFSIGDKGYIGIGYNPYANPSSLKDFYEYNPSADTWTTKADFPDPEGRTTAIGFSIGNKGYVGTGFKNVGEGHKDFWEFNPSENTWTQKEDVGTSGRYWAAAFAIGNTGYVGGGEGGEYELVKGTDGYDHAQDYVWAYTIR